MLKNQKTEQAGGLLVVKIDFSIINFFTIDYRLHQFLFFRPIEEFRKIDITRLVFGPVCIIEHKKTICWQGHLDHQYKPCTCTGAPSNTTLRTAKNTEKKVPEFFKTKIEKKMKLMKIDFSLFTEKVLAEGSVTRGMIR